MAGTVSVLPDPGTVLPFERYGIDPPEFLLNLRGTALDGALEAATAAELPIPNIVGLAPAVICI